MDRVPEPEFMDLPEEARAYADADFSEVNEAYVERLIERFGVVEAEVVDLGTGPADIPVRIAVRRPGWRITAVDASEAMLAIASGNVRRAGLESRIRLVQADAKGTGLAADSFDLILSNSILHHVADPARFWREVRRLARPGARLFLRDLVRPDSTKAAAEIVEKYAGGESALLRAEFYRSLRAAYTPGEVQGQLEAAGLGSLGVARSSDRHLDVWGTMPDDRRSIP